MAAENVSKSGINFELSYSNSLGAIICILGVISNMLLLVAFIKDPLKYFRNSSTYLVMNLAVCDCATCLLGPVFHISVFTTDYSSGWRLIYAYVAYWFGMASILSITSISIDRFLMIAYPIKHRILVKGKAMILWLTSIWIVSLCAVGADFVFGNRKRSEEVILHSFGATIVVFSSVFYVSTCYKLKQQSRSIALQNSTESRAQEIRILKEKRFLNTIIIIACITFLCILPSIIILKLHGTDYVLGATFMAIFYINYAVNPLIYIARFPNYRKTFHQLYCLRRSRP
ncbi:allatostatin-A receptor-like [Dendronephthya gigantea]|uniref:allatostatin-A receptor-like n=1 Tax=Dendronephthya gigantea TaxID=151771 RepID=UPI00106A8EBE|nr:allatostatin-A receptor-like [Dendronephthya gigantea]